MAKKKHSFIKPGLMDKTHSKNMKSMDPAMMKAEKMDMKEDKKDTKGKKGC